MDIVKKAKSEWQSIRIAYLQSLERNRGLHIRLRNRVWGFTEGEEWVALPGVTATSNPDLWWLAIRRDEYARRRALGAILLCAASGEPLRDFGLPDSLIAEVEPHLSLGTERPQLYFTVIRRRSRFELQLKGGRSLDITDRLGDLSWIDGSQRQGKAPLDSTPATLAGGHSLAAEATESYQAVPTSAAGGDLRFFARATGAGLEPVDRVELQQGAVYLVSASPMGGAPRSAALRRIVARGGPTDLPRDLAAQHDHYAHGAYKR